MSWLDARWRARLIDAGAALLAAVVSFVIVYALCRWRGAEIQPAMVAAILAIGLSARPSPARAGHVIVAFAALPVVAVAAGGIAWLLHTYPIAGAIVFTAGLVFSVWVRNFGGIVRRAGALIAMPLIALLVVPPPPATTRSGRITDLVLAAVGGAIALACVTLVQSVVRRMGWSSLIAPVADEPPPQRSGTGISVTSRMALQMAVALSAAFVVGFLLFPGHWGWTVLTAFIVCSGARGRGDAAYKGVLRLLGALAGTIGAVALAHVWLPTGPTEAVVIFALLFAGLCLRDVNYAYWAGCITVILAILGTNIRLSVDMLGVRLEAILAGAICAVAASWFVMPIRTESVIRRRLADALLALDEFITQEHPTPEDHFHRRAQYERRMKALDEVSPPVVWHRRLFVRGEAPHHPARWIELSQEVRAHTTTLAPDARIHERKRASWRRAIGLSRRAIANHGKPDQPPETQSVTEALEALQKSLAPAE